ncbi:MAG: L-threonylcarbamoyladenylate synthase [Bacteroidetes bacterium]|nr:L-threonylcarbamoyladenylate synthase [Bacteroidota bacterium]
MFLEVNERNPNSLYIKQAVKFLKEGGIIIFPTDTIYAIGCDLMNYKAIERLCKLFKSKPEQTNLALICYDLKNISDYTTPFDTPVFKMMKQTLPGPYTFILKANANVTKIFHNKKKTVGIRVPNNNIARMLIQELGNPIVSKSIHSNNEIEDYITDPYEIFGSYEKQVDCMISDGYGNNQPSTIIDCTEELPYLVREGKGEIKHLML